MADSDTLIRVPDTEAVEMLRNLTQVDMRSMGNEVAWIVRQEWARRLKEEPERYAIFGMTINGEPVNSEHSS